jgi:ribosomal protein S1
MGWSRVEDTSQVVAPGESITVKVLRIEDAGKKIALGMKQLLDDPWSTVQSTYQVGQTVAGRVTRLADFGAFVELEPGIEGLAHASTFAPKGSERWTRSVAVGMTGPFEILSIDMDKKRIGVALVQEGSSRNMARAAAKEAAEEAAEVREYTEGQKTSAEGFGSLADRLRGALDPQRRR